RAAALPRRHQGGRPAGRGPVPRAHPQDHRRDPSGGPRRGEGRRSRPRRGAPPRARAQGRPACQGRRPQEGRDQGQEAEEAMSRPGFPPLALALVAGCAAEAPPPPLTGVDIPVHDTTPKPPPPREDPPASGVAKPYRFPRVFWAELPGGLKVATLPGKALP